MRAFAQELLRSNLESLPKKERLDAWLENGAGRWTVDRWRQAQAFLDDKSYAGTKAMRRLAG